MLQIGSNLVCTTLNRKNAIIQQAPYVYVIDVALADGGSKNEACFDILEQEADHVNIPILSIWQENPFS